jgi:hypothetical protein
MAWPCEFTRAAIFKITYARYALQLSAVQNVNKKIRAHVIDGLCNDESVRRNGGHNSNIAEIPHFSSLPIISSLFSHNF